MRENIENRLLELGVSPILHGFDLICDAVEMLIKDGRKTKMTAIYKILGVRNKETENNIERKIRYAISKIDMDIYRTAGGVGKKNGEVLGMIAFWVAREEKDDE